MEKKEQQKDMTTISIERDLAKDLHIIKISSNAKNLDEVIRYMIKRNKEKWK